MHLFKLLTISSITLVRVSCALMADAGISERGAPLIKGLPKDGLLTKGGPLTSADEGYTFHISFDDAGKLGLDPAIDKNILKNPITTIPINGQHVKRGETPTKGAPFIKGGPLNGADNSYVFHISFDDAGKMVLDPVFDKDILKNPISTHSMNTTPTNGLHSKRQRPSLAADDAYTFHISFDDAGKMVLDPVFNKEILEKHGMLDKPAGQH